MAVKREIMAEWGGFNIDGKPTGFVVDEDKEAQYKYRLVRRTYTTGKRVTSTVAHVEERGFDAMGQPHWREVNFMNKDIVVSAIMAVVRRLEGENNGDLGDQGR